MKRARTGDENFSNTKSDGQGRPRLNKGFPTKVPLVLHGSTMIWFPTLNLKEAILVVLMWLGLLVQNREENMMVSA